MTSKLGRSATSILEIPIDASRHGHHSSNEIKKARAGRKLTTPSAADVR